MPKTGCRHCMCSEVDACGIQAAELPLLLVLRRPVRCAHCGTRQYSWIAPIRWAMRLVYGSDAAPISYRR